MKKAGWSTWPPACPVQEIKAISGVPMKEATKVLAGLHVNVHQRPDLLQFTFAMTATRVASVIASS